VLSALDDIGEDDRRDERVTSGGYMSAQTTNPDLGNMVPALVIVEGPTVNLAAPHQPVIQRPRSLNKEAS
jgi:hypothetical protein